MEAHRVTLWVPPTADGLSAALEGLTAINATILTGWQSAPFLYESSVTYRREKRGPNGARLEDWLNVYELYSRGEGDCEDLAAARAAELRVFAFEPARAIVLPTGRKRTWHAVVQRANGVFEDPSKVMINSERRRHRRRA